MSELKQRKSKKTQSNMDEQQQKLTKEEEAIAKYLRFNLPSRKGNLMGMKVEFFIGSKAVDFLMKSKWATGEKDTLVLFTNRQVCTSYLQRLLNKSLYHRAAKIYKDDTVQTTSATSTQKTNDSKTPESTPRAQKRKQDEAVAASKKKFKLEMHEEQKFFDANEPYVWIYDPTTTKTIIIGTLLVLASIGICLFPLWPTSVREGVYYVSLGGAWFLGGILAVAAFKYVLFAFLWVLTIGNLSFWLFPNLTEDVGFFESFWPMVKYSIKNSNNKTTSPSNVPTVTPGNDLKEEATATTSANDKLPIDEQLMKKFDEEIQQDDDDDDDEDGFEIVDNDEDEKKDN